MDHLNDSQIAEFLGPYYSHDLPEAFCDQVRNYIDLLLRWNRRMSLTTITDPLEILRFHFGESLFAIAQVPIRHGRLADVGSGAGFPAVPIRMALQGVRDTLIESNHKKCAFLSELTRELSLTNVDVHTGRMEDMNDCHAAFDFVTARAIAIDAAFLDWSSSSLKPSGTVVLWLGQDDSKRISLSETFNWRPALRIPDSERRVLLVGTNRIRSS
jgi:16S rRNA (guanine527-N7)-methyltransferase